jgi:hypothetical protein
MDSQYTIIDSRLLNDFKIKTFSGFKKNDVFNILFKSIDANKVENACNWIAECIVSGYTLTIFDKLISYACRVVHINNPKLPFFLLNKTQILHNQLQKLNTKNKDVVIILRNSQMIRNMFFDIITTLCASSKTKKYDKLPKITEQDFDFNILRSRFCANMNMLSDNIIHFNDPEELRIIMNEFSFNLKNPLVGYDKCCYWVLWLIKWEELHKKKKNSWQVDARDVPLKDNLKRDVLWVIWECIFEEIKLRKQNNINDINNYEKQIYSLYNLCLHKYSTGKRNSRLPIVFLAIGYLTLKVNINISVRNNIHTFIQSQCNVNKMFLSKKIYEENKIIPFEENKKKSKNKTNDIMESKISDFNSITF